MNTVILAASASAFAWGILGAFLGSIKPRLAPRLGIDHAQFGRIVATWRKRG